MTGQETTGMRQNVFVPITDLFSILDMLINLSSLRSNSDLWKKQILEIKKRKIKKYSKSNTPSIC